MNHFKRTIILLTFIVSCAAIVLLGVAAGTEHWIDAEAKINVGNVTDNDFSNGKRQGKLYFGLFRGEKDLNYFAGLRKKTVWIKSENEKDSTFINFPLWVATIIFLGLSMVFGITAAIFSIINAITTPIEAITGVVGLYMWNGIALFFNFMCVLLWLVQYFTKFKDNVMNAEERLHGWDSKGKSNFGYSFWLVVGAMFLYVLNELLIFISTYERDNQKRTVQIVTEKPADGIVMLF